MLLAREQNKCVIDTSTIKQWLKISWAVGKTLFFVKSLKRYLQKLESEGNPFPIPHIVQFLSYRKKHFLEPIAIKQFYERQSNLVPRRTRMDWRKYLLLYL